MKLKKEYIALFILIAALSFYLILRNPDKTHYKLPALSEIPKGEISQIEVLKTNTPIFLNKSGNRWQINPEGYLADADRVNNMLEIIEKLTLTALVSESKNYDRYGLDNQEKITVKAWQKERIKREFYVGKAASSFRHTFVKIAGDHRVYHARENFRSEFDQTVDNLRDKAVLTFEQNEIQEIHIAGSKQPSMVLRRLQPPVANPAEQKAQTEDHVPANVDMLWQGPNGEKVDESKLRDMLAALSSLKCDKYIYDKKKTDLTDPVYTLTLKGAQDHILSIFSKTDKDDTHYPAISSGNDDAFFLSDWKAKKIMLPPDEMLKKPETTETPDS